MKRNGNIEYKRSLMAVDFFHKACDFLAAKVSIQLFSDPDDPSDDGREYYWVGDEIGGLCDFGDTDFLTPTEMVLIIEKNVSYEQYAEWRDALLNKDESQPIINLRSWLMGARYGMLNEDGVLSST